MKIYIKYCSQWNYRPRASRLESELKKEINVEVELIPGASGVYDISANGKLLFSKAKSGRFPEPGEIVALVKKLL